MVERRETLVAREMEIPSSLWLLLSLLLFLLSSDVP
jgi:hypothetical protein